MRPLNRKLIQEGFTFPPGLIAPAPATDLPVRVLQFGEGNFLRGFVDWMIQRLNVSGRFSGGVLVVQPIATGLAEAVNGQDGLYTLLLRGVQDGRTIDHRELVSSIVGAINPYEEFERFLSAARLPHLSVIVSNTTEAGIVFKPDDRLADRPPASFPGKLTRLLWERFAHCGREAAPGLAIVPCELIERNGDALRTAVRQTARNWQLPDDFIGWLEQSNEFANTLVDRIVTGYPKDEATTICRQLGYEDRLLVAGEPFHLWVIEASPKLAQLWPFHEIGLNVIFTDDLRPYRDRKVRILNGAHTMTAPAAYLMGLDTVGQCMADEDVRQFMEQGLFEEIIPTLDLPRRELESFAASVLERFSNPHVRHELFSITLNSTSKFRARLVPSILEYARRFGRPPSRLAFATAALALFYRGGEANGRAYAVQDDLAAVDALASLWRSYDGQSDAAHRVVEGFLALKSLWGIDLREIAGFSAAVTAHLTRMLQVGVRSAIRSA